MSYAILYRTSVRREMRRLEAQIAQRVDAAITALADNPRPAGCLKLSGPKGLWRIRVGDFRIVYEIQDKQLVVVSVANRREVYRGM
jgi:mRNA interferase RelE/StbE